MDFFLCVWVNMSDNKHCTYDNNSKPSMNAHISRQSKITMRLLDICIIIKLPAASLEVYGLYEQGLVASLLWAINRKVRRQFQQFNSSQQKDFPRVSVIWQRLAGGWFVAPLVFTVQWTFNSNPPHLISKPDAPLFALFLPVLACKRLKTAMNCRS